MALQGPWGLYLHIPKCGGLSIQMYLQNRYGVSGQTVGGNHAYLTAPPKEEDNVWTVVRHPAHWLLSYFTYCEDNNWIWGDRPTEIGDLFRYAEGAFWPTFVKMVCERNPGAVGKVFDLYCIENVKVYQLENIDDVLDGTVPRIHSQEIKPVMTDEHWDMICKAEAETLKKYGYDNQR